MQQPSSIAERSALPGQAAAAYIEKRWGGPTRLIPLQTFVVSGPVRVLQNNPRRMEWIIVNPSSINAYFGFTAGDASTASLPVFSGGGSVVSVIDEDGEAVTYEVWMVTAGGVAQNIYVLEIVRK